MQPNRIVAAIAAACGLAGAIAVPLANLDLNSTLGVLGGVGAIVAAARKWLTGWQAHEQHQHDTTLWRAETDTDQLAHVPTATTIVADAGDKGAP